MLKSEAGTREISGASLLSIPDDDAIERIRAGDTESYEIIMRRYNQRLFRVARSILQDDDAAQDAVQKAHISAFFKLDRFASSGSFAAWLTRIAVNEALMIKRKDRIYKKQYDAGNFIEHESGELTAALRSDPADLAARSQIAQLIEQAVDQLPEDFRTVFVLRAIQQLSAKETAESLDIKEATVKTRYHRARKIMQVALNRHMDSAGLRAFEFAGKRCDSMVATVFKRIGANAARSKGH